MRPSTAGQRPAATSLLHGIQSVSFGASFDLIMLNPAEKSQEEWPMPVVKSQKEPHFLFIITPPFSGSTALSQVLNSAYRSMLLTPNGEGQSLIPGMTAADRWEPEKKMNWDSIRATWLNRVHFVESLVQEIDVVIEKSPPNLVRIDQLIKVFPNHSLLAFNRNPFANCASILYREYKPAEKNAEERIEIVRKIAAMWLFRSRYIKKWIDQLGVSFFSYEAFCKDPRKCIDGVPHIMKRLEGVDFNKEIQVKKYPKQGIVSQNARQIGTLTADEIAAISKVLQTEQALVKFFGYDPVESARIESESKPVGWMQRLMGKGA